MNCKFLLATCVILFVSGCGTAFKECSKQDAEIDVLFLLDGSGSVGPLNFIISKDWIVNVTKSFNFENGSTRVGVIQYSKSSRIQTEIELANGTSFEQINTRMREVVYQNGGDTRTATALFAVAREFQANARPGVKKVMILVTDGKASDKVFLKGAAQSLRDINVTTIAVGVGALGTAIEKDQLRTVANGNTSDERVYTVGNFTAMESLVEELSEEITCVELKCSDRLKDVMFVLDGSGSIYPDEFETVKDWVINVTETFDIDTDLIHVGVVQYSYYEKNIDMDHQPYTSTEIPLGATHSFDQFKDHVKDIQLYGQSTYTAHALMKTAVEFEMDARVGAMRIVVLLTDGQATDAEYLKEAVQQLNEQNITTYAVGVGKTDKKELGLIANGNELSEERVYEFKQFDELESLVEILGSEIRCDGV